MAKDTNRKKGARQKHMKYVQTQRYIHSQKRDIQTQIYIKYRHWDTFTEERQTQTYICTHIEIP